MDLIKWTKEVIPKFPKVVESFFGKIIGNGEKQEVGTLPSVNISDEEKAFEVSVAVPGLDKKDIKVEVHEGYLKISSEKQYEREEREKNWMRREFGYASFQRIFQLPSNADPDKVQANLKNGILQIRLGKKATADNLSKVIEVK
ncbi:Hsp20/alpha crystallin family protein [Rhodoflexus sp.]